MVETGSVARDREAVGRIWLLPRRPSLDARDVDGGDQMLLGVRAAADYGRSRDLAPCSVRDPAALPLS